MRGDREGVESRISDRGKRSAEVAEKNLRRLLFFSLAVSWRIFLSQLRPAGRPGKGMRCGNLSANLIPWWRVGNQHADSRTVGRFGVHASKVYSIPPFHIVARIVSSVVEPIPGTFMVPMVWVLMRLSTTDEAFAPAVML
jgi:hypothetical protein